MDLFWNVDELIDESYVDVEKIDNHAQLYGAISGLVESLGDPYSVFMSPEETETFNKSLSGELEGIGAELTENEAGELMILAPLKNSPAEKAGILPGDYIYMVNGQLTTGMSLFEAIMNIRGEPGTEVQLTLLREGMDEAIEVSITRQAIIVPSVELSTLEEEGKSIAHLTINQFGTDTYNEFEEAVRQITLDNPDGLILDLRMNGGGYLDAAVQITSEFFEDEKTAVIVKYRDRDNQVIKTTGDGQLTTIPMVVLIDGYSASASEILAGTLQDYERATLIGEQSFGKGSVQELDELSDGSTLLLTVAKWYTPLDRSIDETGITPDIEVKNEAQNPSDLQLDAALNYLVQQ
ncbi:S41 family peptidase [Candidatus Peregrinibacteria bacterium]|nr:MAG: S41 family peptidase [Candidatus Peregrinibacteria bacterium]